MPLINSKARRIDWVEVKRRLAMSQEAIDKAFIPDDQRVQAIFHRRSLQLARRHSAQRAEAGFRALVIALGQERYGLELRGVLEVLAFANCTPAPGAPLELLGVINLRGEIRPVASLSRILGLVGPESAPRSGGYIAMLRGGSVEVGLRVDQVERIAFVSLDSLSVPGEGGAALPDPYVRGVTPDRLIVLDLSAILSHPLFTGKSAADRATDFSGE